jgi:uncharacterized protein
MTRFIPALYVLLLGLAAATVAGCGDDPLKNLLRNCAVPDGTRPFTFDVGEHQLTGFIDAPAGPGPHPAILLIQSDGPTDITRGVGDARPLRDAFRSAGIASAVWDKAGSGCSGGRYRGIADLYLRADEVVAAVDALTARDDIDSDRIGAWAQGQGGWVAPMAAVRSADLAYLIVVGGPARDPISQRLYLVRKNLELEGYPDGESDALVESLGRALEAMAAQVPYEDYVPLIRPVAQHPIMEKLMDLGSDIFPTARRYDEIRGSGALDVSADVFLPAVDVPVLAIWGRLDSQVDWRDSESAYRQAFETRSNGGLTVRVFDGASHALCNAQIGSLDESRASGCTLVDGYVDTMLDWLRERGFTRDGASTQSAESTLTNAAPGGAARR